ncbi:CBS domain-containing protein [Haloplanus aerogenes]|uniref:CBS domain-containing protein n=1 Tax=Haloplanus aerogenes TaxID=660522 RepID=A0A3M0DUE3_9EURY|nr:CBS domain-containing protein [Haloplanus aerogenes]AZH25827.1 CBS domain-containing protein [Haloplanus aerogenes]RMB25571.1 CBS domain-containing protein [Haloplanus aerogenes]
MDIADIVSEDFVEFAPDARVSKLAGAFGDSDVKGVVVRGDDFEGVVTRRQLATSHHQPNEKAGSVVWHVPRLDSNADVREVAQLMIDSDSKLLPVFEGESLIGAVTADDVLRAVKPFLDAVTVADAYTADIVTLDPGTTVGEALHAFREHRITHLPVVEEESAVGILSLYDVTALTVRSMSGSQGGDASGTDAFGGGISESSGRARGGGYGAREGELERILDLPVRDVMASPVRTIDPDATLDVAVEEMFEVGGSALLVTEDDQPAGIVTKTDVLDSLTWEAGGNRSVQLYGADLLDDVSYDAVVAMIDKFDDRGHDIIDAKIHLHEHKETLRGTPLLLARIRLHTDRGQFIASGEGYGAQHAINEARDVLERRIRDEKTRGKSKKHPDAAFWERRFGWLLEE